MDGPGMSLFQGAPSFHINNSAQDRLEEQEELEDAKRRNEELKHDLVGAFEDLENDENLNDDASSVNLSGNHTIGGPKTNGVRVGQPPTYNESLNHQFSESPKYYETPKNHIPHLRSPDDLKLPYSPYAAGDGHNFYPHELAGHLNGVNNFDGLTKYESLKVMNEMSLKECQQFASQNESLKTEIDSLRARLQAAIQDKDKAELSLQESQHLLASSKHKLLEREQQISSLTDKIKMIEDEKQELQLQVTATNVALQEKQQRLLTLQVAHSHDTDALFREQQDRHREEVDRLQSDLMKAKNRLEEKENEIKVLERRCVERQKEKEDVLIEKGDTINRLAGELEAAQRRVRERDIGREQLRDLGSKLKETASELVACRKTLAAAQRDAEDARASLHHLLVEWMPEHNIGATGDSLASKLATLKEVLSRYKQQMQKLPALQDELAKRDKRLEHHRKQESELRSKLEESKGVELQLNSHIAMLKNKVELLSSGGEDAYRHENVQLRSDLEDVRAELKNEELKYAELEMEYEKLKTERGSRASLVQDANADLLRELDRYAAQLKDIKKENGDLKTLYLQVCSARDAVTRELKDVHTMTQREKEAYRTQERELVERVESERRQVEKLTAELTAVRQELDRANCRISELQTEFTDKQREFTDKLNKFLEDEKTAMRKEISACIQCDKQLKHIRNLEDQISKYSVRLAAQESNETLMKELKGKAEFFQKYILERYQRLSEQCSVATNTDSRIDMPEGRIGPENRSGLPEGRMSMADNRNGVPEGRSVSESGNGISESRNGLSDRTHEPDGRDGQDTPDTDNDDDLNAKTALMMKEKAIRDQIAEKFTLEMKTIEMNCARRLKEMETEQLTAVTKLKNLLERKAKEVETLKEFILAERAKVTQILESKENEISVLIKEHNELQVECQKAVDNCGEWKHKAEKYKEKLSQLGSLEDLLKREKDDWKQKTSSECQTLRNKVMEQHTKISHLEQQCDKLNHDYQMLLDKYKNAKRTVVTCKDYIAKKDEHVHSELSRIQEEYRKIFVRLQEQIDQHAATRAREARHRPAQTEYAEKLKELSQDFARLTQTNTGDKFDKNK
ncbi:intracellular protein transport protein USO1-like [Aricia agestis]|uniref:intracellular protein transport protein USO1-like n=1 Tax=Aricia agestis TaxID=91739 RepID=UPI001C204D09|nr:intracellular protein transport protein USO1-like [Aricia agestis]